MYDSKCHVKVPLLTSFQANNPSGGLGLTTGIVDAVCYGNAISRVINDEEPDELLTECATSRRNAWLDFTSPISEKNFKRDSDAQDPEGIEFSRMFFGELKNDPDFATTVKKMHDGILIESFARPQTQAQTKQQDDGAFTLPGRKNPHDASNGHAQHSKQSTSLVSESPLLEDVMSTQTSAEYPFGAGKTDINNISDSAPPVGQKPPASAFRFPI